MDHHGEADDEHGNKDDGDDDFDNDYHVDEID